MSAQFLEFEKVDRCPGCRGARIHSKAEREIGQCGECQLYFRNPRPTQAEIARSYDIGATFEAWQDEEPARAKMWQRRLALLTRHVAGGRLLDVGTGDGRFLAAAQEGGFAVVGTEVSEAGASYVRERGFDVHLGQITDLALPNDSFDLATIWHVLEHVPDPAAVLRKIHGLLRPGGILAVAVPNEENFFLRRRFGQAKTSPFDPLTFGGEIHLSYFRPATLRAALRAAGFHVMEFGVDDIYHRRNLAMRLKLWLQQILARAFGWHFAVAMYAVCRRVERPPQ
ncbi:MAG: class I SAM-dependent methyltransferase [Verrucomicrobiota bacterium]|nr:class I SAM-dependent methyltransferase [Verrucomicrobiota bacterium]